MRKEMLLKAPDREISTSISKRFTITLLIALFAGVMAQAQNLTAPARGGQSAAPAVEDVQIIIQSQQVRIAARSNVVEMQLQIFDQAGAQVYDSGLLSGSELSWALQNASGEAVLSGLYAYTLMVKEANTEPSSLRRGHMIVERGRDHDPQTDRIWVTSQGSVGAEAALSGGEMTVSTGPETNVVGARIGKSLASKGSSTLNVSNFGTAGQIPVFAGTDSLIDSVIAQDFNGRIGIGTSRPNSMLTVTGQIETTAGGIKFPDGTVQSTSAAGALSQVNHNATLSGNGTNASPLGIANGGVSGANIASGQVVKSVNGLSDNVSLSAGSNITITPAGNGLSIAAPNLFSEGGTATTLSDTNVTSFFGVDVAGTTINNLPAGDYIYTASVYVTPIGASAIASCRIRGTTGTSSSTFLGDTTVSTPQWIPIIGRLNLFSQDGAVISCSKGITNANGFKAHGALTLVRVQTIH